MDCAKAKRPSNTLFTDLRDVQNITVEDLEDYLGLVVSLFRHSPKGAPACFSMVVPHMYFQESCMRLCVWVQNLGEFSTVAFQEVFMSFDATVNYRLSQAKTQKDRSRWANDVLSMHEALLFNCFPLLHCPRSVPQ